MHHAIPLIFMKIYVNEFIHALNIVNFSMLAKLPFLIVAVAVTAVSCRCFCCWWCCCYWYLCACACACAAGTSPGVSVGIVVSFCILSCCTYLSICHFSWIRWKPKPIVDTDMDSVKMINKLCGWSENCTLTPLIWFEQGEWTAFL